MSVACPGRRRALCALIAISPAVWSSPAVAVDKAACVAAAESGQRLRKQGQLVAAREQLVACASPDCPQVVSQDCTGWLGEVQRSLASFVVRARDSSGNPLREVAVILDGTALSETAPTAAIEVDPGDHVVRCEHPGFAPSEQHVLLAEGERAREIGCDLAPLAPGPSAPVNDARSSVPGAALQPVPAAVAPPTTGLPWELWPLGGLAVAGFGGFAAFGIAGTRAEDALKCAPNCMSSDVASARRDFTIANVSVVVGAVALGAAALVLLLHETSSPAHAGARATRAQGLLQFPLPTQTRDALQFSLQH
jgi:hypothetical protein